MPRVKLFDEEKVLDKAMELFSKMGYNGTSIQDLVSHLGISRASLYSTYGDKRALFEKSLTKYRNINTQGLGDFLADHPNVNVGFKNLFEVAISEALEDKDRKGCFMVNTTTELVPQDNTILKMAIENKTQVEKTFYQYLLSGEQAEQFSKGKDLKAIASMIYILYSGIRVTTKIETNKVSLMAAIKIALKVLDKSIR